MFNFQIVALSDCKRMANREWPLLNHQWVVRYDLVQLFLLT